MVLFLCIGLIANISLQAMNTEQTELFEAFKAKPDFFSEPINSAYKNTTEKYKQHTVGKTFDYAQAIQERSSDLCELCSNHEIKEKIILYWKEFCNNQKLNDIYFDLCEEVRENNKEQARNHAHLFIRNARDMNHDLVFKHVSPAITTPNPEPDATFVWRKILSNNDITLTKEQKNNLNAIYSVNYIALQILIDKIKPFLINATDEISETLNEVGVLL